VQTGLAHYPLDCVLRRFEAMGLVESTWQPSEIGPRRRYDLLTGPGTDLLRRSAQRSILIFQEPSVARRLGALLQGSE
jgi:DNA-binding PadR family transcriptional regulator